MKKFIVNYFVLLLFIVVVDGWSFTVKAAVWQWSVTVQKAKNNNGYARAYLWIPPDCSQIKAFIFSQNNMEEQSILENPYFRKKMGKLGIAEIWVSPAFDGLFNFEQSAGETFNGILADLANISGYQELIYAPFIGLGHSAAASAPYYMAAWNPARAIACISVSGQWPYFRSPLFAPDIWGNKNIDYIPSLETMGEYEAADSWSAEGLTERQQHPLMPLSMLASPAQGHFAATQAKINYIALYIKKAIQYRYPKNTQAGKAPVLIAIDPTKTGWLADRWRYGQLPITPPAPVDIYKGNTSQAFWFFDGELVNATVKYQAKHCNQLSQLIGYFQDGKMVEQRDTHQQVNLKFEPEADGITFKLHTAFYDTVPGGSPRLPVWAGLPKGSKIGHVKAGSHTSIERITGPVIKLDDSTFQLHPQLGFRQTTRNYELWFAATNSGDRRYKPMVQQSQMIVPSRNTIGKVQHITFNALSDQPENRKSITLTASSDAGVPVSFYIAEGPAEIWGDQLKFTRIPLHARYPIKVTVVAWQYGNSNEPRLQTADQIAQTFYVYKTRNIK